MTLDFDFMQIETRFFGTIRTPLKDHGLEWPPPELVIFDGENVREAEDGDDRSQMFQRYTMSKLTDEQAEKAPNVARGAAYGYLEPFDVDMGLH